MLPLDSHIGLPVLQRNPPEGHSVGIRSPLPLITLYQPSVSKLSQFITVSVGKATDLFQSFKYCMVLHGSVK